MSSQSLTWVPGAQEVETSYVAFLDLLGGSWIRSIVTGTGPGPHIE